MFKHLASVVVAFLVSSQALASHYDHCEFKTEVVALSSLLKLNADVISSPDARPARVVALKVLEAVQHDGHGTCSGRVGSIGILELDAAQSTDKLQVGSIVKIDFATMGGLTPTGFWDKTTWTIIE